jgi:hypothetical protein
MNSAWGASILSEAFCAAFAVRSPWRFFAAYLGVDLAMSMSLFLMGQGNRHYFMAWIAFRATTFALQALAVHEAVRVEATARRASASTLALGVRWRGIAVSVALAAALTLAITPAASWAEGHRAALSILRAGTVLLVGWLLAATATARVVPTPWRPAARHRWWLLGAIGGELVASILIDVVGPSGIRPINVSQQVWIALCYLAWPRMVAIPAKS